jgi:hypothetical protein
VYENRVLWKIFAPERREVTGGWRELHKEELRGLYSLPSVIKIIKSRKMRWAGQITQMGEKREPYRLLEGKRPLGRSRCMWVDKIRMDIGEIGWGGVDWIGLS